MAVPHRGIVPTLGQAGATEFDGNNVTDFLDRWEMFCDEYGFNEEERCCRLLRYCVAAIGEIVEILPGYITRKWDTLKKELKDLYWQYDTQKNTTIALIKLVKEAPFMDLNVYLKFTAVTDKLVASDAISSLDHIGCLLDGLSMELRKKIIKFCTKKAWKLSVQNTGTGELDFQELKQFVFTEQIWLSSRSCSRSLDSLESNSLVSRFFKIELELKDRAQTSKLDSMESSFYLRSKFRVEQMACSIELAGIARIY